MIKTEFKAVVPVVLLVQSVGDVRVNGDERNKAEKFHWSVALVSLVLVLI